MALFTVTVGAASVGVIGANPTRRKITFHNPNIVGQQVIYGAQQPTAATVGSGLALLPGEKFDVYGDNATSGWNFIGSAGGANVTVTEHLFPASANPQSYQYTLGVGP